MDLEKIGPEDTTDLYNIANDLYNIIQIAAVNAGVKIVKTSNTMNNIGFTPEMALAMQMLSWQRKDNQMRTDIGPDKGVLGSIATKMVKRVKIISKGRIQGHYCIDVSRIEVEDDGTYTVIVEE